ncbi:MAG: hypothetical protein ACKO11_16845 [Cuspidothrix sp.]
MITIVVLVNIVISLILLYLAQKLRKITYTLAFVADSLNQFERATHQLLDTIPENIYRGAENIHNLRLKNQIRKQQVQQIRQVISLIILVKQIYQSQFWLSISKINK